MSTVIPTSFTIPKDYLRAFYFEETETGFKQWIIVEDGQLRTAEQGAATSRGESLCLEWSAESIMRIRADLDENY